MEFLTSDLIEEVRLSYGRCITSGGFFDDFYDSFLSSSEAIRAKFAQTDFIQQKQLLRHGISFILMYAKGSISAQIKVDKLGESHAKSGMNIEPWMYDNWQESLIQTVRKHDKKITDTLVQHWKTSIGKGINRMQSHYYG